MTSPLSEVSVHLKRSMVNAFRRELNVLSNAINRISLFFSVQPWEHSQVEKLVKKNYHLFILLRFASPLSEGSNLLKG